MLVIDAFPAHSVVCGVFCLTPPGASRVGVLLPSSIPKTLTVNSVAIWGRDTRIVILTGSFWLVNLGGALYGNFVIICHCLFPQSRF